MNKLINIKNCPVLISNPANFDRYNLHKQNLFKVLTKF